jgi:uncharacterized protein involved in outer membrane biogenesis
MKKIILGGVVVVVGLLIVGLVMAALSLDGLVKQGVETVGPQLTKVTVKLEQVKLSLLSGGGQLGGLVVGNPEGFNTPHAISLGSAQLVIQPSSLLSDKIVVRTIRVVAPEINLEAGLNGTNLKKILTNVQETTGGGGTNAPVKTDDKTAGPGKKFEVDEFLITGAKLNFTVTGLGGQTVTLPEIHLTNLGQGPAGITSAELTQIVLAAIEKAAAQAVSDHAGDIAKGATSLIKGLTGKTNSAAIESLGKGLGDLLKKK